MANTQNQRAELTKKEMQILGLIYRGLSSKEISAELYRSQHTVENHRCNMLNKTGAKNSAELIGMYADLLGH